MFQKIFQKYNIHNSIQEFLKSSSLIFGANIFGAILGYILVIIVSHQLENISIWTALNSFVMIVGIIINGFATDISKRSAELLTNKNSDYSESYSYLITLKRGVKKAIPFFLLLSPFFAFAIQKILGTDFMIAFIILLNIPAQVFSNMNNHFLMGTFQYFDFAKNMIMANISRFAITVLFLFLDFGVYALVFGIVGSVMMTLLHNHFLLQKFVNIQEIENVKTNEKFSLQQEISNISSTIFANISLQIPFLILPLIAVAIVSHQNADIFAIFFTIGQIINFGIISFLGLVVPFAAGRNNSKIFWVSLVFTVFGGICAVLFFVYFRNIVFSIFSRPEYSEYVAEMSIYFSAVALFNILFFVGRYMIGKGKQKKLFPLFGVLGVWIISLFLGARGGLELLDFLWWVLGLMVVLIIPLLRASR